MTDLREVAAQAFYEAMYAEAGGVWSAVETKNVWRAKADAVLAAVSGAVGEDVVEAACKAGYVALEKHLGRTVPLRETGPTFAAITAATPIIALAARDATLEEVAKWLRARAAASNIGERDGALVENELYEAADDMLRALKGGPARG